VVVGYVIMRAALVPMWLRVARDAPRVRGVALRYAAGISGVQVLWVARLLVHDQAWALVTFVLLAIAEMAVPYVAENSGEESTPWHVAHVVERFSLFTIIVLGEVILATTQAISVSLDGHGVSADLMMVISGGLLLVLSLWWVYFKRDLVECIRGRNGFLFGYAHYFALGAVAAVGATLATNVDLVAHHAAGLGHRQAALCLAAAVAVYLLALGSIHASGDRSLAPMLGPAVVSTAVFAAALVTSALSDQPGPAVLAIGVVATAAVVDHQVRSAT
jgi:low temperature requirement protein LtrA